MPIRRGMRTAIAAASTAVVVLGLAACSGPGGGTKTAAAGGEQITAPITAEQVAKLGKVNLSVWADQGEQQFMQDFVPAFEKKYPNVTVKIQFKSFNDLTATVLNAMNSNNAPDVAQGNQGWATDGALVKAGLVRPLDDLATAYGYQQVAGEAISQLKWSKDGKQFGTGSIYGLSPDNQMVGLFYNKEKLQKLGLSVPKTLPELEAAMAAAKAGGEVPLELGNSDKGSAMQSLSIIQGALTPAKDTRSWITGVDGTSFDNASNAKALDTFAGWVKDGYVSAGYDGTSPDDAAAAFSKGSGVFFVGGNWYAGTITDGAKYGFTAGLEDGKYATNGSFGLDWHVSSQTKSELAALAFVGMVNSADAAPMLAKVNRVPIHTVDAGSNAMFGELLKASSDQLSGAGPLFWYDWATDTMFDTFTSGLQSVLAGQMSSQDFLQKVQADWTKFHTK
ncbi:ABC transporter substrate-binding protein [Microbacterium sp. ASV49]|uniref:Extracellular solute-binding protein n=1 Tax=Microbacterium candidum TaxID=3041922 RepID=A0ABT7MU05_9MICO|nr:extracellular solute-binding protein [Microbacterium sp. ASV49]MDL9977934.1 extracellular solute-binding protein [Microbacterium sp. ASV49]